MKITFGCQFSLDKSNFQHYILDTKNNKLKLVPTSRVRVNSSFVTRQNQLGRNKCNIYIRIFTAIKYI